MCLGQRLSLLISLTASIKQSHQADPTHDQCEGGASIVIVMIMASIRPRALIFCMMLPYFNLFLQQK